MQKSIMRLADLLEYPGDAYLETLESVLRDFQDEPYGAGVSANVMLFREVITGKDLGELQEIYTRTFDINPVCSLNIGWHLYGENYTRGAFLVTARELLRRYGIQEGTDLPDHLGSLLRLLPLLAREESAAFSRTYLLPSIRKMQSALEGKDDPFEHLLKAVEGVITRFASVEEGEPHHG